MKSSTLLSIAKSKVAANRIARELDIADLKKVVENLQAALTSAQKREAKQAAARQAADLKKLKALMAKMGLSAVDVGNLLASPQTRKAVVKQKRGPRKGKRVGQYRLKTGKDTQRTGRGRMPVVFREFIEKVTL